MFLFRIVQICVLLTYALANEYPNSRSVSKDDEGYIGDSSQSDSSKSASIRRYDSRPDVKESSYERIRMYVDNDFPPGRKSASDRSHSRRVERRSESIRGESYDRSGAKPDRIAKGAEGNEADDAEVRREKSVRKGIRDKGASVAGKLNEFRKTKKGKVIIGGGVAATAATAVAGASALALGATALGVGGAVLANEYC
jgi:hypothetical protein